MVAQTHSLLFTETLLLLFQFAGFTLLLLALFALSLFAGLALLVGLALVVGVVLVVGVIVALVVLVATLALQLCLNRLVDGLRCLTQSDGGLLVGGVVTMATS